MRYEFGKSYLDNRGTKQQESRRGIADLETANMRFFRKVEQPGRENSADLNRQNQTESYTESDHKLLENFRLPKAFKRYIRLGMMYTALAMLAYPRVEAAGIYGCALEPTLTIDPRNSPFQLLENERGNISKWSPYADIFNPPQSPVDDSADDLYRYFKEVAPPLWQRFAEKKEIHVNFDPTSNDTASANADKMSITMNPKKMENNSHTINGIFDHEVTHLAQEYPPHIHALYKWLVEGIADYVRKKYGSKDDPWSLPRPKRGDKYTDGYGVAARFLIWLEKHKSPRIVDDLHERLQKGTFTLDDFRDLTGLSLDELWKEYERCPALEKLDDKKDDPSVYKLEVGKHDPSFDHLVKRVQMHFKKVYPDLFKRFADPCRAEKVVHLEIDPDYGSPAGTIQGKRIVLGPKHLGPDAVDAEGPLTNALANLVYDYPKQPDDAAWLVKGMADYARHTYGPKNDTWTLPRLKQWHKYTDGGGVAARFLVWLEKKKSPRIVDDLHERLQRGTFTKDDFRHLTGQSVDELWVEYESCPALEKLDSQMYNSMLYKLEVGEHDLAFDHLVKRVQTHFKKVYPDLFKRFVDPCRAEGKQEIRMDIDPDQETSVTTGDGHFTLGPKHLGPDAADAEGPLTYALANLVQSYPSQSGDAAWLMQGMADYARHTYGPKNDTWTLPRLKQGDKYTDSFGVAARFLVWLEKNKSPRIVDDLHRLLQSGRFTMPDFLRLTRQTVDELWEEYHSNQLAKQQSEDDRMALVEGLTIARNIIVIVASIALGYVMYKMDPKLNKVVRKRKSVADFSEELTPQQREDIHRLAVEHGHFQPKDA